MRVLLDTNVVLDLLLERQPWYDDARAILASMLEGRTTGFVSAGSLAVIHYVVRRHAGAAVAIVAVERCLQTFQIVEVDRLIAHAALSLKGTDFEDDL